MYNFGFLHVTTINVVTDRMIPIVAEYFAIFNDYGNYRSQFDNQLSCNGF